MRILRLDNSVISPAVAVKYTNPKTKAEYYNIVHGGMGRDTWKWICGLDSRIFTPTSDTLELTQTDFNLKFVYKGNKQLKDFKDNPVYNIIRDNDPTHCSDIMLLWTIVAKGCKDITYAVDGEAIEIGKGSYGKRRGNNVYIYPAPVLEIYGDCVLTWSGTDARGMKLKQVIEYEQARDKWVFQGITKEGNEL